MIGSVFGTMPLTPDYGEDCSCPVCEGKGMIPEYDEGELIGYETCSHCDGTGFVEPEDPEDYMYDYDDYKDDNLD